MIITIIGRIRSGKSTVRQMIQEEAKARGVMLEHIRFADPIYKEVQDFYKRWNIPYRKFRPMFDAVGEALAEHGTNDKVLEVFESKINSCKNLITDDARRTTQAKFLRDNGSIFIKVGCSDKMRKDRCSPGEWTEKHVSDVELKDYECDYYIHNANGLDWLRERVKEVCDEIFGG